MAKKARYAYRTLVAAACAAALAACAGEPSPEALDTASSSDAPPQSVDMSGLETAGAGSGVLDGTTWSVVRINGAMIPEANAPTLAFGDQGVTGSAGCNRYFGPVSVTADGVSFAAMGVSRRACAPDIMDLETDFLAALRRVDSFELQGDDRLELSAGPTIQIEARRQP